jgi:hypothetical protein
MRKARSAHLSSRMLPGRCVRRSLEPGCPAAPGRNCLALLPPGPDAVRKLPVRGTWPSTLAPVRPFLERHPLGREFSPAIAACGFREPLAPRLARPGKRERSTACIRSLTGNHGFPWAPPSPLTERDVWEPPRRRSQPPAADRSRSRARDSPCNNFVRGTVPVTTSFEGLSLSLVGRVRPPSPRVESMSLPQGKARSGGGSWWPSTTLAVTSYVLVVTMVRDARRRRYEHPGDHRGAA